MELRNKGYSPPPIVATISPAAPLARVAAVLANISFYILPVRPRAVLDQRDVPCCVSCALGAAMEVVHPAWPPLAPLFHYYVTRYDNGDYNSDGFLNLGDAIGTLTNQGICKHDLHPQPYTLDAAAQRPSQVAYTDAIGRRILRRGYHFQYRQPWGTSRVDWIRQQLRQNCPVVVGLRLPTGYPDSFLNQKFEWQDPETSNPQSSGHCVLVLGYDDTLPALKVQDSQGPGKFEAGCWWMGYRVADSQVVQEVYSLIP